MKKLIFILIVFFACLEVKAQDSTIDYIYSSDGFEVKTGYISVSNDLDGKAIYRSTGLYSKDGKILVAGISKGVKWSNSSSFTSTGYFYIIDGCETIASCAFQGLINTYVYIPSSVKYIAPDAIISRTTYSGQSMNNILYGVMDGCREESNSGAAYAPTADPNAAEVARYNIQGIKLNEPTEGINIVQMSDGTAEKVLVK